MTEIETEIELDIRVPILTGDNQATGVDKEIFGTKATWRNISARHHDFEGTT